MGVFDASEAGTIFCFFLLVMGKYCTAGYVAKTLSQPTFSNFSTNAGATGIIVVATLSRRKGTLHFMGAFVVATFIQRIIHTLSAERCHNVIETLVKRMALILNFKIIYNKISRLG